jgi:imidazolonepropionase-like amidohydrolase
MRAVDIWGRDHMYSRVIAVLLGGLVAGAAHAASWTVRAGQVFDTEHGRILHDQWIEIDGARIRALRPARADDPAPTVDWSDRVVMPGWIDCHTHLIGDIQSADVLAPLKSTAAQDVLIGARNANATLLAGFTTVRDVGTYRGLIDVALRDAILRGDLPGPRMRVAGAYITVPGGGGEVTGESGVSIAAELRMGVASTPAQVRDRVRRLVAGGADFIKVIATGAVLTNGTEPGALELSPAQMRAAVDEAQRLGVDVTAHAHGAEGIKQAIRAGVRSIEHASLIDDEGIALAKAHGVFLAMDIYNGDYIEAVGTRDGWDAEILRKNRETTDAQREGFRKALAVGVNIVFATDSGVYPHGDNARQFAFMLQHGMTEMQAVQAATWVAARLLRLEHELGSLAPGKVADLVALPQATAGGRLDFTHTPQVVQSGRLIERPAHRPMPLTIVTATKPARTR